MSSRVLVTGATRGIGRAIALRLADGNEIVATGRSTELLATLQREIEGRAGRCRTIPLDLRDADAIAHGLDGVEIDVLVNNAGVMHMKPILQLSPAEWQEMVDVNFSALYHVTRAVLPGMIARGRGHVINIASIAGRSAFIGGAAYAATKHAVLGFSESVMLEVRDHGVRVSVVMPGSVATELFPPETDTSWMLKPEDVAEAVAGILAMPPHALVYQLEVRAAQVKKR